MIFIKTNMKQLPCTCKKCIYNVDRQYCGATNNNYSIPDLVYDEVKRNYCYPPRPDWCPLCEAETHYIVRV